MVVYMMLNYNSQCVLVSLSYSNPTSTFSSIFIEFSVTLQSYAKICTPAAAAARRASPKALCVSSLG